MTYETSILLKSVELNALVATLPSTSLEERNLELDKLVVFITCTKGI